MPTALMPKQSGIIPYRRTRNRIEVLLITSSSGRWITPKGNIEPHLTARLSAGKEAFEEAGVRGRIHPVPVGTYAMSTSGGEENLPVEFYLMEVSTVLDRWPEDDRRERRWVSLYEAPQEVDDDALRTLFIHVIEMLD